MEAVMKPPALADQMTCLKCTFAAEERQGLLWPEATTFLKSQRDNLLQ